MKFLYLPRNVFVALASFGQGVENEDSFESLRPFFLLLSNLGHDELSFFGFCHARVVC